MKKIILSLCLATALFIGSCSSDNGEKKRNNQDTSMRAMDATGPMQDKPSDTTTIHQLPGDSVPMRKDEKKP